MKNWETHECKSRICFKINFSCFQAIISFIVMQIECFLHVRLVNVSHMKLNLRLELFYFWFRLWSLLSLDLSWSWIKWDLTLAHFIVLSISDKFERNWIKNWISLWSYVELILLKNTSRGVLLLLLWHEIFNFE